MNVSERDAFVYVSSPEDGVINWYILGPGGELTPAGTAVAVPGIAPLAVDPANRNLFAASKGHSRTVMAYRIGRDGGLDLLASVRGPAGFHYLSVDGTGRFLLGASYGENTVAVLPIGPGGYVCEEPICLFRPGRNPHCILTDHSNRFAYSPNLGSDHVAQFRFDEKRGTLIPNTPPQETAPRESGPRHMVFSPDNRFAFVLTELSGDVLTFSLDGETGALHRRHRVPIMPPDSALAKGGYEPPLNSSGGENAAIPVTWAADLRITPDGRFLYASERTTGNISCLSVDGATGRVDFVRLHATEAQPRALGMDDRGRFLAAAGEKSDAVAIYAIDQATGELRECGRSATGKKPYWIAVVPSR